jgi:hypothetical protein
MKRTFTRLTLCCLTLATGIALSVIAADKDQSDSWSEDGVLKMSLELIALPDNDLQKAQMKLTVTNTGTNGIVLDKTLAAGFSLRFKTDLSAEHTRSDEKDVTPKEAKKLEKPTAEEVRARFVRLAPGQSLSCTFDLAKPNRDVVEGHASDMDHVHHGFYYEAMQTYQVPAGAKRLEVDAWYERGVWMMATAQFEEWYGQSAEKLGLWDGRARSNRLVVEKK